MNIAHIITLNTMNNQNAREAYLLTAFDNVEPSEPCDERLAQNEEWREQDTPLTAWRPEHKYEKPVQTLTPGEESFWRRMASVASQVAIHCLLQGLSMKHARNLCVETGTSYAYRTRQSRRGVERCMSFGAPSPELASLYAYLYASVQDLGTRAQREFAEEQVMLWVYEPLTEGFDGCLDVAQAREDAVNVARFKLANDVPFKDDEDIAEALGESIPQRPRFTYTSSADKVEENDRDADNFMSEMRKDARLNRPAGFVGVVRDLTMYCDEVGYLVNIPMGRLDVHGDDENIIAFLPEQYAHDPENGELATFDVARFTLIDEKSGRIPYVKTAWGAQNITTFTQRLVKRKRVIETEEGEKTRVTLEDSTRWDGRALLPILQDEDLRALAGDACTETLRVKDIAKHARTSYFSRNKGDSGLSLLDLDTFEGLSEEEQEVMCEAFDKACEAAKVEVEAKQTWVRMLCQPGAKPGTWVRCHGADPATIGH